MVTGRSGAGGGWSGDLPPDAPHGHRRSALRTGGAVEQAGKKGSVATATRRRTRAAGPVGGPRMRDSVGARRPAEQRFRRMMTPTRGRSHRSKALALSASFDYRAMPSGHMGELKAPSLLRILVSDAEVQKAGPSRMRHKPAAACKIRTRAGAEQSWSQPGQNQHRRTPRARLRRTSFQRGIDMPASRLPDAFRR